MANFNESSASISLKCWNPEQVPTLLPVRRQIDCHDQQCVKFKGVGVFHSRAQLLYSAIMEGTASVIHYVPRPFTFNAFGRRYTPSFFVNENNHKYVRELGSRPCGNAEWLAAVEKYCDFNSHTFEVIPSEWVFERQQLAENWLTIVRMLARNADHFTEPIEQLILLDYLSPDGSSFGDLVRLTKTDNKHFVELAVLRLVHRGVISTDLQHRHLSYDTEMKLCTSPGKRV